jgi:acyl-CoA synthetase (AMP-forming)/AMP-acid ligase II
MYLTDYLSRNAKDSPTKIAVSCEGEEIDWQTLWRNVEGLSDYFGTSLSDDKQEVVALLATNSISFITIYLAVVHAGHIVMPIDPVYKKLEIDAILGKLKPSMLIYQERYK